MAGDQTTVKVHNFVKDTVSEMIEKFKKNGISFKSETAFIDISVLRMRQDFDNVNWKNQKSINDFAESIIDDFLYLEESKLVKVKMRGKPFITSDVK